MRPYTPRHMADPTLSPALPDEPLCKDGASSSGVFYPNHDVRAVFANEATARAAEAVAPYSARRRPVPAHSRK